MKRVYFLMICFTVILMLCASSLTCYAAETTPADDIVPHSEILSESGVADGGLAWMMMLLNRVAEYCAENEDKLLDLAGSGVITFLLILLKRGNDKNTNSLAADLKLAKNDASKTATSQGAVVGAVNGMIDSYNAMRMSYEKYESIEDDRNKLVGAVMVQNTALLEILSAVYVNNKNLPQGVKDMVLQKKAHAEKLLDNDPALVAIVNAVRAQINEEAENASDNADENTEAEDTEVSV